MNYLEVVNGQVLVPRGSLIGSSATGGAIQVGTSGGAQIEFAEDGNNDELHFITHHGGAHHRRMLTIDKDGNIGIGTDKPRAKLEVRGGETTLQQEDWQPLELREHFAPYTHHNWDFGPIGYYKDSTGSVYLNGAILPTDLLQENNYYAVAQLPEGYRSSHSERFAVAAAAGGEYVIVTLLTSGDIAVWGGGSGRSFLLNSISFRAGL